MQDKKYQKRIYERFRLFRKDQDLKQGELAEKLGISQSAVAKIESNKRKLTVEELDILVEKFDLSINWLLVGLGTMYNLPNSDVDLIQIPRVKAQLSAGNGSLLTSEQIERTYAFRADWIHSKGQPSAMVIFGITGSSMQPELQDKDVVMIDQSQTNILPGHIYGVGVDESILVKYVDIEPGKMILRSENSRYSPIEIDITNPGNVRILGKVVWSARDYQ